MKRAMLAALALLLGEVGQAMAGPIQAYSTADTTGNQNYGGNLGLDFNVISPITITALGAFDSGGLAFSPGVTVGIYQRIPGGNPNTDTSGALLGSLTITNQGTLMGNYSFVQLKTPLTLAAGYYDVDAVGFNGTNLDLNEYIGGSIQTNNGGGLLSFVGSGRFDPNSTLDFPSQTTDNQGFNTSPHVFGGGSFLYTSASPTPEPSAFILFGIGLAAMGVYGWRRRKLKAA